MSRILKIRNNQVTQKYGKTPYDNNHLGVDVVGYYNALDYIVAHTEGYVSYIQDGYNNNTKSTGMATYGNMIELTHPNGYKTRYAHLQKGLNLKKGDRVAKGQVIGFMSNTGNSYGAHLHFEVLNGNTRINPEPYIDADLPKKVDYTGVITYQAYTDKWLPEVNKCDNTDEGFAGLYGKAISGLRCKPEYGEITVQVHIKNGNWLDKVSSKNYKKNDKNNPSSYAGIYGEPIDCIKIKSTKGHVDYRVHTVEDGWLAWVNSKTETGTESYAGIYCHTIDGIQMK